MGANIGYGCYGGKYNLVIVKYSFMKNSAPHKNMLYIYFSICAIIGASAGIVVYICE